MSSIALITFIYPEAEKYLHSLVADLNAQTTWQFNVVIFNDGVSHPGKWLDQLHMPFQVLSVQAKTPMSIRFEALKRLRTMDFDYLIFQDSDDGLSPNRVEVVTSLLSDYPLVVNDLDIMDDSGKVISPHIWKDRFDDKPEFSSEDLEPYNFSGLGNTAIRTQLLDAVPNQPDRELIAVDWYLFYCIMKTTSITGYRTSDCTTLYRQHNQNSIGRMTADKRDIAVKVREMHVAAPQAQGIQVIDPSEIKENKLTNEKHPHPFWWEIEH